MKTNVPRLGLFKIFALSSLLYLAANASHLIDPPYWDAVIGVYHQGAWLYRHGIHYLDLLRQPTSLAGGPNVNVFYAFSTLFALLLHVLPLKGVFLFFHLVTIAAAGLSTTLFFLMLRPRVGPVCALGWVLAAALNPIWTGQAAAMYIDLPYTAMAALSLYAFWKKRYAAAALTCLVSYFVKNSALLQAAAYLVVGLLLLGRYLWRQRRLSRETGGPLLLLMLPCPLMVLLNHWVPAPPFHGSGPLFAMRMFRFIYLARYLYPVVLAQLALATALILYKSVSSGPRRLVVEGGEWWVYLAIYCTGFMAAFIIYPVSLTRYMLYLIFPLAALLALLLQNHRRLSMILVLVLCLFNAVNQRGSLLGPIPAFAARSGDRLERSREYLEDLETDRDACRFVERSGFDGPILSKWPFALMLALPELGYVSRPLAGVVDPYGPDALPKAGQTVMCVYSPSIYDTGSPGASLKPRPSDRILWTDRRLPGDPVVIYLRN